MNFVEVIGDRKFLNKYRNGDDFSVDPTTDYSSFLQGNLLETLRLNVTYDVYTITEGVSLRADANGTIGVIIRNDTIVWKTEGFSVGDTVRVEANGNNISGTVTAILGNYLYINAAGFFGTLGVVDGETRADFVLKVTSVPTSLIFKFGLNLNSNPVNSYTSLLDGQEQKYQSNAIGMVFTSLTYTGTNSGNLGTVQARYTGTAGGVGAYKFRFEIKHTFRLPHHISSWLINYTTGTIPADFAGSESWRYTSYLNFGKNVANPNDGKVFLDDFELGSVGFSGQNFNTGTTDYSLQSISYEVGGVAVDKPEVTATTTVTAVIKRDSDVFTAGVKAIAYHSWLPSSPGVYSLNSFGFTENFVIDELSNVEGAATADSSIITNFEFNIDGGDAKLINLSFDITYTGAQQSKFTPGDYIFLGFEIENESLTAELSDRTVIELAVIDVTRDSDVPGLITSFQLDFNNPGSVNTFTGGKLWNNRALEASFIFRLSKSTDFIYTLLTALNCEVVAYNTVTGNSFELNTYNFPLPSIPVVDIGGVGHQILNLSTERNLPVPAGDALRDVTLNINAPASYIGYQTISGSVGLIFPWRQWMPNALVDLVFYDAAQDNNNLNYRTSNYSGLNNYVIKVRLSADIRTKTTETEVVTPYYLWSDTFEIADFDEDQSLNNWGVQSYNIYNTSGTIIDAVNRTEINRIEFVIEGDIAGTLSKNDTIIEIIQETVNATGRHYRLHSSLDWTEDLNPLEPISGEDGVRITPVPLDFKVKADCLIDGTKVDDSAQNFYFHIYPKTT